MSSIGNVDTEKLIKGCISGERKYQQLLYKQFYGKMFAVCCRYVKNQDEAKDLLQEGFIKVFEKLSNYNNKGSFEGWVRRIMVNNAIDHFRKSKNIFTSIDEKIQIKDENDNMAEEDDSLFSKFKANDLIAAIQKLSPAYQTVFNLYVVEGYSHQDIADELNISVGTSKSNLAKAKMNLRKELLGKINTVL